MFQLSDVVCVLNIIDTNQRIDRILLDFILTLFVWLFLHLISFKLNLNRMFLNNNLIFEFFMIWVDIFHISFRITIAVRSSLKSEK